MRELILIFAGRTYKSSKEKAQSDTSTWGFCLGNFIIYTDEWEAFVIGWNILISFRQISSRKSIYISALKFIINAVNI